jgi:hypothetical protein
MSFAKQCMDNLQEFYTKCQDTGITMTMFLTSDLSKPKLETTFKHWVAQNLYTYYLCEGIHNTSQNMFIDIYDGVNLKALIANGNPDQSIKCSHIDFGIHEHRIPSKALFMTHTAHIMNDNRVGTHNLAEYSYSYNFILTASDCTDAISFYQSLLGNGKLQRSYNDAHFKTLLELCTTSVGLENEDLCNRNISIARKTSQEQSKSHQGIEVGLPIFTDFLVKSLLSPISKVCHNLQAVTIIHDQNNELGEGSNEHILIAYHFADNFRNLQYIKTYEALVACFVACSLGQATRSQKITDKERRIHDTFQQEMQDFTLKMEHLEK